mmetsp:Transcript_37098/g.78682  ORF Transcript_37098/g.78682 Transcript_37098/m.78682 type:complete len:330 (-) Transcript_37098:281-1270(-)|eukprot:CAMPEP_0206427184 /NCGR_PEP_ID=MMETSP0324_2-20121206/4871_1 /ASSEMBLY_ACC=CAM_ASM_000836 /TAXON_ID=2866 /ORGANISM="Crypthecodinium cohnii, Strain Seligo" /LENGTH=329 /DNA_ID=CAMNT_0053892379 /DNA_START=84 /DNA_END=1073 /DNA_ORIENTATION=+
MAAPTPPARLSAEDCERLIEEVGKCSTEEELKAAGFEPLTVGFANQVCGTSLQGQELIVKRYTDLVFLRLTPDVVGAVDSFAGEIGLGPKVFYSSPRGLVMERLPGETLGEPQLHADDWPLLESIATRLADCHCRPAPKQCQGPPMLWRTIDKMMEVVKSNPSVLPPNLPGLDAISEEISKARAALEKMGAKVVLGHGDFKPSNIIRHNLPENGEFTVTFIDFELGGPNYRAFDLMKVFRTALPMSERSMLHFYEAYAREVHRLSPDGAKESAEDLLAESRSFEPLTWLEAAVFFLTLPLFKPSETQRWQDLAEDRWRKFMETKQMLNA